MKKILLSAFTLITSFLTYAQQPTFEWVNNIAYGTGDEIIHCLVVDKADNLYVVNTTDVFDKTTFNNGDTLISSQNDYAYLLKTNPQGNIIWKKPFNHGRWTDPFTSMEFGELNHLFIAGSNDDSTNIDNIPVLRRSVYFFKYDSAGNYVSHQQFPCTNSLFKLVDMEVDDNENVYLTGFFNGTLTVNGVAQSVNAGNMFIIRINADNSFGWFQQFDADPYDMTIGPNGHPVIGGRCASSATFGTFTGGSTARTNPFILQLDSTNGTPLFLHTPASYEGGIAHSIHADKYGNYYMGGTYSKSPSPKTRATMSFGAFSLIPREHPQSQTLAIKTGFIAKYNPNGTPSWARNIGKNEDGLIRKITSVNDSIYFLGHGFTDILFDTPTDSLWVNTYEQIPNISGSPNFIVKTDTAGNFTGARPMVLSDDITEFIASPNGDLFMTGAFGQNYQFTLTDSVEHIGNDDAFIAKINSLDTFSLAKPTNFTSVSYNYTNNVASINFSWTDNSIKENGFVITSVDGWFGYVKNQYIPMANATTGSYSNLSVGRPADFYVQSERWDILSDTSNNVRDTAKSITTSLNKLNSDLNVKIFPNPVSNYLTVVGDNQILGTLVEIYSVSGKIVLQQKVLTNLERINVNSLSKGVYWLKIKDKTVKMVKQ